MPTYKCSYHPAFYQGGQEESMFFDKFIFIENCFVSEYVGNFSLLIIMCILSCLNGMFCEYLLGSDDL